MKWIRNVLVALSLLCAATADAQRKPVGIIEDDVRGMLAAAWNDTNATQSERAYCVLYQPVMGTATTFYRVYAALPALVMDSSQYGVAFLCPTDIPNLTILHTHPPTSCVDGKCVLGGYDSYACEPSPGDQDNLNASDRPVALVQCDRNAVVFYLNERLAAEAAAKRDSSKKPLVSKKVFAGAVGAALVATKVFKLDQDPCPNGALVCTTGSYKDGLMTTQPFSDKAWHGASAWMLTGACTDLDIGKWKCATITTVAGIGFEFAQGYVSVWDIGADALGAFGHAAFKQFVARK